MCLIWVLKLFDLFKLSCRGANLSEPEESRGSDGSEVEVFEYRVLGEFGEFGKFEFGELDKLFASSVEAAGVPGRESIRPE